MKKLFFLFHGTFTMEISSYMIFHDSLTNTLKKFPDVIVPRKSMCNLKTSSTGISVESYMIYFPKRAFAIQSIID